MSRGTQRENAVKDLRERDGWIVTRAAASLGDYDLHASKAGEQTELIEVKSTAGGPYERFGPQERADIREAARKAGARARLAYWPPRKPLRWIESSEWPT